MFVKQLSISFFKCLRHKTDVGFLLGSLKICLFNMDIIIIGLLLCFF